MYFDAVQFWHFSQQLIVDRVGDFVVLDALRTKILIEKEEAYYIAQNMSNEDSFWRPHTFISSLFNVGFGLLLPSSSYRGF